MSRTADRLRWSELWPLLALLGAGLLVRLAVAFVLFPDSGHRTDLAILTEWAHDLARNGPGSFYRPDAGYFADYPPVYLYVLWLTGVLGRAWSSAFGGADVTPAMIKLPFMLADIGAGALVFLLARRLFGPRAGLIGAAAFLFNPAVILVSTIWAQNDSIATLFVVAAAWLLASGRTEGAAAVSVIAMLVKFQYGFMIPVVALVGWKRHVLGRSSDAAFDGRREWRRVAMSLAAGTIALLVICLPFGLVPFDPANPAHSLLHRFIGASQAFPGVTQNAFNLWMDPLLDIVRVGSTGLTEGRVVSDTDSLLVIAGLGLNWQTIGNVLFLAAVAVSLLVLRRRDDGPAVTFVALVLAVSFFVLPTRVHERYLYPALAFGIPFLAVRVGGWRALYAAISLIAFLDVFWVFTLPVGNGGPDRGLLGTTVLSPAGIYFLAFVSVIALVWLVRRALDPVGLPWGIVAPSPAADRDLDRWIAEGAPPDAPAARAPVDALAVADPSGPTRASSAAFDRLVAPLTRVDRSLAGRAPGPRATLLAIGVLSLLAAIVAARVGLPDGPWLWNLDLPKIHYPLASLYHDALEAGHLPLWSDRLGLGFPLYAEGQIGAFYPPDWLIFRLPPLIALDVSRTLHLTLAGIGTGLLTLRLTGSRSGAAVAVLVAVLGGGIATKLEWYNLVTAYGWLPWVLLPLVRRPHPTRVGIVLAGVAWGIQALAGHPNIWLLTGLTAVVLMLATTPRARTLVRIAGFGLLGMAVGSVQLIPTLILTTLSVRNVALSKVDLFTSAATPFDLLGFGFANPFAQAAPDGTWNLATAWYPDGSFALLEAGAFVGLPVIAFAAVGLAPRRARPLFVAIGVLLAIPIVAAFQPDLWLVVPLLNGLRSPVRAYLVVAVLVGVLAGFGVGRLGRAEGGRLGRVEDGPPTVRARSRWSGTQGAIRRAVVAVVIVVGAYGLVGLAAVAAPATMDALILAFSTFLGPSEVEDRRALAIAALTAPLPFVPELVLGAAALALVFVAERVPRAQHLLRMAAILVVALPLVAFGHAPNPVRLAGDLSFRDTSFVQAAQATAAAHLLTIDPPGWYPGMPDQLAAAGVNDIRMFSSLDLAASDALVERLLHDDPDGSLRRAVGIDVVVTFGRPCPGRVVAEVPDQRAFLCRPDGSLDPPYWMPQAAIAGDVLGGGPIRPAEATVDLPLALSTARSVEVIDRNDQSLAATVDAPSDGWVWVDQAWYPTWVTTVDGGSVPVARALAGQLVPVPAGRHEIRQELLPWDAGLGLTLGIVVLGAALASARRVSPSARR